MKFHHMMIVVSDMEAAIKLWRDIMGFTLNGDFVIPDGEEEGPNCVMYPKLVDSIFGVKGARSRCVLLTSPGGSLLELEQPEVPKLQKTPKENLRYGHTGIHELGLLVKDIDSWFERIRAAGYETQTDHVWSCGTMGRSFLFYDQDGNLIQLWEAPGEPSWS